VCVCESLLVSNHFAMKKLISFRFLSSSILSFLYHYLHSSSSSSLYLHHQILLFLFSCFYSNRNKSKFFVNCVIKRKKIVKVSLKNNLVVVCVVVAGVGRDRKED